MARTTIPSLRALKGKRPIVMLTAYDAPSARLVDAVADVTLVGDSVGTTVQGRDSTLPVTIDQMVYHAGLVSRACTRSLVVGDMPFMSYQVDNATAVRNAGRFLQESGCHAVKLEGGAAVLDRVRAIVAAGIPVMGHLGFTPQSVNVTGVAVHRDADQIVEDALMLQDAGAFALVLEMVPAATAADLTRRVAIPTIGIGAGVGCDGQVLVFHDVLGFNPDFKPKFLRQYMDFHGQATKALAAFRDAVINRKFPDDSTSYS